MTRRRFNGRPLVWIVFAILVGVPSVQLTRMLRAQRLGVVETPASPDAVRLQGTPPDAAAGDPDAFDDLYRRHKGPLYRYMLRQCGDRAAAEELFQDVWLNVIRARATYTVMSRFVTYLYRFAHNRLIDHYRRRLPAAAPST